jgi:hypothetical protein
MRPGHRNITCLYDMDIVGDPTTFNEVYLYEGVYRTRRKHVTTATDDRHRTHGV